MDIHMVVEMQLVFGGQQDRMGSRKATDQSGEFKLGKKEESAGTVGRSHSVHSVQGHRNVKVLHF